MFILLVVFREKSKKFAEQAAAIVCLRVLGVPEGRIGEEESGLVCKRKRERKTNGTLEEEVDRKRHIVQQEADESTTAVGSNGGQEPDSAGADTPSL